MRDELYGEMFESLNVLENFKNFRVDPELETIVWENGADFAPEFLRDRLKVFPRTETVSAEASG